jgi:hypothetical protein
MSLEKDRPGQPRLIEIYLMIADLYHERGQLDFAVPVYEVVAEKSELQFKKAEDLENPSLSKKNRLWAFHAYESLAEIFQAKKDIQQMELFRQKAELYDSAQGAESSGSTTAGSCDDNLSS